MHTLLIHPGETKLRNTLQGYFNIPSLAKKCKYITERCELCNVNKINNKKYRG